MKTSKIILLAVAVLLVVFWSITLFFVRKDIKTILAGRSLIEYSSVSVEKFSSLDFSGNWIVQIRQGKDCIVELGTEEGQNLKPELKNINGTLYLSHRGSIHAKITAPILQEIKAAGHTSIQMKNFWTDSLTVVLGDSSTYAGSNNDFKYISFQSQ